MSYLILIKFKRMIKRLLLLQFLLLLVFTGSQAHGQWKKCMDLCLKAGTFVGGATSLIGTPVVGAWLGMGTASLCYITCGPGTSLIRCFHQDTLITTKQGSIQVKHLKQGDTVLTADFNESKVVSVFLDPNEHEFIAIYTSKTILEVTPEHLMIVNGKLIKAQKLMIGMKIGDFQILQLKSTFKKGKVTVVTDQGTLIANEIPTTILCDQYENMTLNEGIEKWRQEHKQLIQQ